jgi:type I restriction-modification system DNA methylase subunit/restriction endonuclease S subunit
MDKPQYFGILKQLHDINRNNPAPKLIGMDAYNEGVNYLYLRHLSDNSDEDILRKLYKKYCTDKCIQEDLHNIDMKKVNLSGKKFELYRDKLSEEFLPGPVNHERNKTVKFRTIIGDENLTNLKVDIGRMTNIIHQDGTNMEDGGGKAQKMINKLYSDGFLPLDDNGKFNINLFPYDALGEGFEKFMNDAGSTGGGWGQHFTNPQIIDWIFNHVKPNKKKMADYKICDPFSGTGGFLIRAKKHFGINADNIYGHEFDDKLYKFLRFNANIAGLNLDHIEKGDSFDYHSYLEKKVDFFDFVFTNPPFGESVDITLTADKKKADYWGIMKSGKSTVKASMGLATYAIIKMLKDGGIGAFVTDRGITNNGTDKVNSWETKLRKYMMENCNITDILLLPKGIFSHTTFDTSVIIMKKGEQTEEIKFHQGYFDDKDKGNSNKKMHVKENFLTISFEQIVNKNWSLKHEDYIEKIDNSIDGIEYKKLGDVCEIEFGTRITQSKDGIKEDYKGVKYPVYGGGDITFYTNKSNRSGETIIISRFGVSPSCIRLIKEDIFLNDSGMSINKYKNINKKYLFYYLIMYQNFIYDEYAKGNGQKNMKTQLLLNEFKIPILSTEHQQRIVEFMDKTIGEDFSKLDKLVSKFKDYKLFDLLIYENYDDFAKLFDYYDDIISLERMYKSFDKDIRISKINRCFKKFPCEMKTLGDLSNLIQGENITKKTVGIKYPVYGGGVKSSHNVDKYNCEDAIILTRVGTGLKKDFTNTCVKYITGKFFLSDNAFYISNINKIINKFYLYYYLNSSQNNWKTLAGGQGQPVMKKTVLLKLKIRVPSIEDQEKIVKMIEEIDNEESQFNKTMEGIKYMIESIYEKVEDITDINFHQDNMNDEENNDDEDEEEDDEQDDEQEETVQTVEYKGIKYILEDNIVYKIKEDDSRGSKVGKWVNGKIEKGIKKDKTIDV